MTTYVDVPDFRDGDILSASRVNAVARNVDVVTGLDEMKVWPVESGGDVLNCDVYSRASDARFGGNQATYYMAHNGDRLFFHHVLTGTGNTATLTYNNQTFSGLANSTNHVLTLASLPRYKIVKITITPSTLNGLFVRQLYAYNSAVPIFGPGSLPLFENGTLSTAAALNTIIADTKRCVEHLNQPIAGMYSVDYQSATNGQLAFGTNRNGYYGYIRHKHNKLYFDRSAWVDEIVQGDEMTLTYNGVKIWSFNPYNSNSYNGSGISYIDLDPALTVGAWYPVEFRMTHDHDVAQKATIWALYEYPDGVGATVPTITRWSHGDTVNGDADGPPQLDEFSDALGSVGTLRWTNPACRAGAQWVPNRSGDCDPESKVTDEFASIRVHRWLAYENIEKADGKRAPVTLQHRTGNGYTFTGTSLPEVTQPSYWDLDNTPIKPGMYFRLVGSKFCIQTPGYEGQ